MADELECMRRAVEQARHGQGEAGRVFPKVGAVVMKDGQILGEAHRGEDEHRREHAEFYLLERKLGKAVLAGSTVFTTLEPCFARGHGKTPCAERLRERRVDRVFIGMLDPDPTVHGKGQMYLLEHGIKVETFDPAMTQEILEMNREFIKDRQTPSLKITTPADKPFKKGTIRIEGVYRVTPSNGEKFAVFTRRQKLHWPQGRFRILAGGKWDCLIDEHHVGMTEVVVAQIDPSIDLWVRHYLKVGDTHEKWVGLDVEQMPPGFRENDSVTITVVE